MLVGGRKAASRGFWLAPENGNTGGYPCAPPSPPANTAARFAVTVRISYTICSLTTATFSTFLCSVLSLVFQGVVLSEFYPFAHLFRTSVSYVGVGLACGVSCVCILVSQHKRSGWCHRLMTPKYSSLWNKMYLCARLLVLVASLSTPGYVATEARGLSVSCWVDCRSAAYSQFSIVVVAAGVSVCGGPVAVGIGESRDGDTRSASSDLKTALLCVLLDFTYRWCYSLRNSGWPKKTNRPSSLCTYAERDEENK